MSTGKQRSLLQLLLQRVLCPAAPALKSQTRPLPPSFVTISFPRHRHCQLLPRVSPTPTTLLFRRHFSSSHSPTVKMSDIVHETIKGKIQTHSYLSSWAPSPRPFSCPTSRCHACSLLAIPFALTRDVASASQLSFNCPNLDLALPLASP